MVCELWLNKSPICAKNGRVIYLWNHDSDDHKFHSLLDYIEANDIKLRAKYISFIHDLGLYTIGGRTIASHLSDSKGYSVWWMSKLSEKSHINSEQIIDCLKLFALEEMLIKDKPLNLVIYAESGNERLLGSIKLLCLNLGIKCSFSITKIPDKDFFYNLLRIIRPWISIVGRWLLRYIKLHWKLRKSVASGNFSGNNSVMFFSYFFDLNYKKCSKGEFYSNQWGPLPSYIHSHGVKINWLHHFMRFKGMRDVPTANSWINSFNSNCDINGEHAFFESYLSLFLVFNAFKSYIRYYIKSFMLGKVRSAFKPNNSANDFWPVLKNEWFDSLRGGSAIRNCMFIELIDGALKDAPTQRLGLYLQENQYWEKALLNAWRRYGHGFIIGVPHASVNFWDLRYSDDIRTILDDNSFCQPHPDLVALHGPASLNHYLRAGYPASSIVEVEALRYLHLNDQKATRSSVRLHNVEDQVNIIILGEIKSGPTMEMLKFISSIKFPKLNLTYTYKSHPACLLKISEINFPGLLIIQEPLHEIERDFDLAIVAGSTSAVIDFYYTDIELMVYLGNKELNLSPLRESRNVAFVRSEIAFKQVIMDLYENKSESVDKQEIFWTDPSLRRWSKLLKNWGI